MEQPAKILQAKQSKTRSDPKEGAAQHQRKAEMTEMVRRHKNVGQKDYKDAR